MIRIINRKFFGLSLILLFVISSCLDKIDFEVPSGIGVSLVIQGRIVKSDPSFVEVRISRLFDFSPQSRQPVNVNDVTLFDSNGNEMILTAVSPGLYRQNLDSSSPINPEIGGSYKIRVVTFDNRIYESTSDLLSSVGDPLALNLSITEELEPDANGKLVPEPRVLLTIDTEISPESSGMFWEVFNIYKISDSPPDVMAVPQKVCYINELATIRDIYVLDRALIANNQVENIEIAKSRIDFRFREGLFYEVHQFSLSLGASKYWEGVDFLSERQGNMFDGPVGEIPTNFKNVNDESEAVFGYFFASEEAVSRIRVPQSLVGNPTQFCPPPGPSSAGPGGGCIWGLCCDCLLDEQASLIRPSFWVD